MKKILTIIICLATLPVFAQNVQITHPSYAEFFKNENILIDVTLRGGASFSCQNKIIPTIGAEFTIMGFMGGFGIVPGESRSGNKDVHVSSYNRIQNGHSVHVKGHYRSKPGHKGSGTNSELSEFYFGYWLPCFRYNNLRFYSTPIVGKAYKSVLIAEQGVQARVVDSTILYGAGIKISYGYVGITIEASNNFATIGFSATVPLNLFKQM